MTVYLDVKPKLDVAAAQAAAAAARMLFLRAGDDIGHGLGRSLTRAFAAIDGSAAYRAVRDLQKEYKAAAVAEEDAARRMVASMGRVEVAQRRLNELTAKYSADSSRVTAANIALADAHARASKAQRDHVDAMVAAEEAHRALGKASADSGVAAARAAQVFNAAGAASALGFGAALLETTKKAGDFQASQQRLVASAAESASNLKTVSDGILKMAGEVGYSAQELSNAMYGVEKAGFRGSDAVTVMRSAAQGAVAENADLKEVVSGLTTSLNDFHYGADQSADVMSKMVTATSLARTTFQEFSGALHVAEPLFANIGKSQGLNAEQLHRLMSDLYGVTAQMTRSGDSAEHASELINHAMGKMLNPTADMRSMMGALGLDAQDISDHLGERGLAGTMQLLDQALKTHTRNGKVNLDVHYQSAQLARAEQEAFNGLSPAARKVAEEIKNNTLSYKEFRKTRGGLSVEQANEVTQWAALNNKLTGFSDLIRKGIGDSISLDQAWKVLTGDQETLAVALQTTGENAASTNDKIQQIAASVREADGTVKGFDPVADTLNVKMRQAKDAFGAAAIEIGTSFVPSATDAANVAKDIGDAMAKHPGIVHGVIDALGVLGGAWLGFKALNIVETILTPIVRGLADMVAGEEAATAAASTLSTTLRGVGIAGAGVAGAQIVGGYAQHHTSGFGHTLAVLGTDTASGAALGAGVGSILPGPGTAIGAAVGAVGGLGLGVWNQITGHAGGGPLYAPGPKGKDSALFWGASGEHVLSADDVDAMGGHNAVYAFRRALHRQYGGAIGPDVQIAHSMAGTPYSQASRHDCSGMVGRVIAGALGVPNIGLPTTKNMGEWLASLGFKPGIGGPGAITVGWYDHGGGPNDGHAAMTLSDGENAESGGSHGDFLVGAGAAGATSPQFDHHMYLPTVYGQGPVTGTGSPGALWYGGAGIGGGGVGGAAGLPPGATPGSGPLGEPGYYTPNPQKVAAAQEHLTHLDERIRIAEERRDQLQADATQAERDRLDEEIRHLRAERDQAQERLARAEQGDFHRIRTRQAAALTGLGGLQFGAPLPEGLGLSGGIKGLGEWITTFLANLAIGPIEGAMLGNYLRNSGYSADIGYGVPGADAALAGVESPPGGYADLGDVGAPIGGAAPAAATGGTSSGGAASEGEPGPAAPPAASAAPSPPPPPPAPNFYKQWYPPPAPNFYKQWYPPAPQTPAHVAPPPPPGPYLSTWQQQQNMLYGGKAAHYAGGGMVTPDDATDYVPHDAGGGEVDAPGVRGRDSVLSWLAPGEYVMRSSAVDKYGAGFLSALNEGRIDAGALPHFDTGGPVEPPPPPPAPAAPQPHEGTGKPPGPGSLAGAPKPPGSLAGAPKPPGPGSLAGAPKPPGPSVGGGSQVAAEDKSAHTPEGVAKPGASQRLPGQDLPPSPGIGFGGGLIGAAESAAEQAVSAAAAAGSFGGGAPAGSVLQPAFQMLNRTAGYLGQLGGIAAEGIFNTLIPTDSPLSDWGNTLPGRILKGISGVRPAQPNTAGQTQPPLAPKETGGDVHNGDKIDSQLNLHAPVIVQANNPQEFSSALQAQSYQAQRQLPFPMGVPR